MSEPARAAAHSITALGAYPVCAVYRFEIPLRAMLARSWCTAAVYGGAGGMSDDAAGDGAFAFEPGGTFLTQRHIALDAPAVAALHANRCFVVHDLDDLLWEIPPDNPGAVELSAQRLAEMDASLRRADLVTASTAPLAAALEARGIPAVIIPNLLDPADWQTVPARAGRDRLRVGWYGQRQLHVDDLRILDGVVAELARDVDFVFYGDVPPGLPVQGGAFECYPMTALELFPAMLARLDLDILLSPLANNAFNACKSNLRLLQAGMLGYAAIASDIDAHRGLPVRLVANTPAAWIAAIRECIGERAAVQAAGRRLQQAVRERFTLDDVWAERIFTTWTRRAPAPRAAAPAYTAAAVRA